MLKKTTTTMGAAALLAGSMLFAGEGHAAATSATTSVFDRDFGSTLLSFSNDQYLSDASTPFDSGFNAGSTMQAYYFNNTAGNGDTSFASIDDSFAPVPQTAAGAIGTGNGSATVLWTFDWMATGSGTATLDLDYLYSATVAGFSAGETAVARSFISVLLDGTSNYQEALNYFDNVNGNSAGEGHLVLNFDVTEGDTGTFTVAVASDAIAAPVPVPAALWLFGSALAGLVGISRRRTLETM